MQSSASHPNPVPSVTWRIICETLGGKLYYHELELQSSDGGAKVMEKVNKAHKAFMSQRPYRIRDRYPIFWSPVLGFAALSTNSSCDLESQSQCRRVFVSDQVEDPELTAAFYDHSIFQNTHNFAMENIQVETTPDTQPTLKKHAMLISLRMNKYGFVALLMLNLLLCFGSGLVAGLLSKEFDLGIEVMSGVATVLACMQTLVFLLKRWNRR